MAESIRQAVVKENSRARNRTADRIEPNRCAQSAVDTLRIAYGSGSLKRGPQVLTLSRAASQNSSWSQRTLLLLQRTRGNQYVQRMMLQTGQSGESAAGSDIKSAVQQNRDGRNLGDSGLSLMVQQTSGVVQRKVGDGRPQDQYEQEADRAAAKVMRMTNPASAPGTTTSEQSRITGIQRVCAECEEELQRQPHDSDEELRRRSITEEREKVGLQPIADRIMNYPPVQRQVEGQVKEPAVAEISFEETSQEDESFSPPISPSKGGGDSLPGDLRSFMEPRFGYEFGDVRIHNDSDAANSAKRIGAAAYTSGNDIYFGAGKYRPSTAMGRDLIAHELVHVIQQSRQRADKLADKDLWNDRAGSQVDRHSDGPEHKLDNPDNRQIASSISSKDRSSVQLAPNVTAVAGPAEMPAGQGRRVTLRATAPRGTAIAWNFLTPSNGAVFGPGTARTNTLTAPAGSTGGIITVQAADAANAADVSPPLNITLVEIQQPTFAFAPPMPAFAPANTMEASVCNNTATANAVVVPGGRLPPLWSIRGNRRGATIDPATGVINPSATQTGNITVRATDATLPDALAEQVLTIRAHPTRITNTVAGASLLPGSYGAVYTHTLGSSGGSLNNVFVTERIDCGNDPVGFCPRLPTPILPGNINAALNAAGQMNDNIGTVVANPGIDVNRFLPSPPNPGLPQVLNTPQILYWRSEQCSAAPAAAAAPGDHWVPFSNVSITGKLLQRGANFFFETRDNGVLSTPPDPYGGPALVAAPAAGSVCPAGVSVSRVRLIPSVLAADGNAATTSAATATARPAGTALQWSFTGLNFGAAFVNAAPGAGNPTVITTGNIAGSVTVRAADAANPGCFAEGRLRLQQVRIGPIRFSPAAIPAGAGNSSKATVTTTPGTRTVNWTIQGPNLGCVITGNPDNSANIVRGAQRGSITVRATDQLDAAKFNEASLVLS